VLCADLVEPQARRYSSRAGKICYSLGVKNWLGFIFAFLFSPALFVAASAPVFQGDGLCRFILHGYYLPKENEDKINFIVADLLQRHEEAFNFMASPDLHVRIRIFGQFKDYEQFARTNGTFENQSGLASLSNLAGYFSVRDQEVVTWRQHDPTYLANNILHECSHAIMHQEFRALPIWLDEGCAVYFSFPAFMRSESSVQRLNYQWFELKQWLDEGSLPDLRKFLNLTPPQFRALPPERTYPISWSLFQFLMGTPASRQAMNEMIREYQTQNPFTVDCAKLLGASYPGGLAKMEKDWHAWIARGAANVLGSSSSTPR
jgi:hypothetical protein